MPSTPPNTSSSATGRAAHAAWRSCLRTRPIVSPTSRCRTERPTTATTSCSWRSKHMIWRAAEKALGELRELAPSHALVFEGALMLARTARDRPAAIAALSSLLEAYPDALRWVLRKAEALVNFASLSDQEQLLERFALQRDAHPALVRARAELLMSDVRRREEARFSLRKAVRLAPSDASNTFALAEHYWVEARPEKSLLLYRLAACSEDTTEHYAERYFRAARLLGSVGGPLAWRREPSSTRARAHDHSRRCSKPTRTWTATRKVSRRSNKRGSARRWCASLVREWRVCSPRRRCARSGADEEARGRVSQVAWLRGSARTS